MAGKKNKRKKPKKSFGIMRGLILVGTAKQAMPSTTNALMRLDIPGAVNNTSTDISNITKSGRAKNVVAGGLLLIGLGMLARRFSNYNPRIGVGRRTNVSLL